MPFFGGTITRRRFDPIGEYILGEWVGGPFVESTIAADVQGFAQERDRQLLPEGVRLRDTKTLYVDPPGTLRTADPKAVPQVQADIVVIEGETYQVQHVRNHRNLILHQKVICVRTKET